MRLLRIRYEGEGRNAGIHRGETKKVVNDMTDNEALLELCLRNTMKHLVGEIPYTKDLEAQMCYAYSRCTQQTRIFLDAVLSDMEFWRMKID